MLEDNKTFLTLLYDGVTWRAVFGSASGRALAEKRRERLRELGYPAVVVPTAAYARAQYAYGVVTSLEQLEEAS